MVDINWTGEVIAMLCSLVAEALRRRAAFDELSADMQRRNLKGEDPLAHRRVHYPRGYAWSLLVMPIAAAVMAFLLPVDASVWWYAYVGLSLPRFIGLVTRVIEPVLPTAINKDSDGAASGTASVDDTSVSGTRTIVVRTSRGRFRKITSPVRYLMAG